MWLSVFYNCFIATGCQICPKGWLLNRKKCYYFKMGSQAWSQAEKKCEDYGSKLVIIDDWAEQVISCSCLIIKHFPLLKLKPHTLTWRVHLWEGNFSSWKLNSGAMLALIMKLLEGRKKEKRKTCRGYLLQSRIRVRHLLHIWKDGGEGCAVQEQESIAICCIWPAVPLGGS